MNNNNKQYHTSQVKIIDKSPCSLGFFIDKLNQSDQLVIKLFVTNLKNHNSFHYSHAYIAQVTKLSRITVQRSIKRLQNHGILESIWRPYNTCLYILNEAYSHPSFISQIKRFFMGFFLISTLTVKGGDALLMLNEFIYKRTGTSSALSNKPAAQNLYSSEQAPWLYDNISGEPNKKVTFEQFEAQFFPKEQYMNTFTEDQLLQLAYYPKETLQYATKMLTKDMAAGKQISNQFAYFKSICERNKNKPPQREGQQSFSRPKVGPTSVWQKEERVLETDFEWCSNVEPKLHEFVLANHPGLRITRSLADARFNKLTKEQQQYLITKVHIDCNCRQVVDTLSTTQTQPVLVTESHTLNWNDMIMTTPEYVTKCHELESPVADLQYGDFPEIMD